jgi:microcystin-dependent protein
MNASIEDFINNQNLDEQNIEANSITEASLAPSLADALYPTGAIIAYVGLLPPTGWLNCDGSVFDTTAYPELDAVLNGSFEDGTEVGTQSRLPDLSGRLIVGKEAVSNRIQQALQDPAGGGSDSTEIGAAGGSEDHTITEAELDSHTHNFTSTTKGTPSTHQHVALSTSFHARFSYSGLNGQPGGGGGIELYGRYRSVSSWNSTHRTQGPIGNPSVVPGFTVGLDVNGATDGVGGGDMTTVSGTTNGIGSSTAHNNLQALQVLNYIIKA